MIIPTFSTEPSDIFYSASVTDPAIDSAIANVSRLALSSYRIKYRIIDCEIGVSKGSSIFLRDPATIRCTSRRELWFLIAEIKVKGHRGYTWNSY